MAYPTLVISLAVLAATTLPPQPAPRVPIGAIAPGFTATDDRGVARSLADYRGKFVVLEWHEKGCPYVTKHYRTGHMQRLQAEWTARGVVWLMISSSAEGAHSYLTPAESRAYLTEVNAVPTAMLLDSTGTVGRAYGATTALHMLHMLHMVIIDPDGKTVYNGAIDDQPRPNPATLATATNYVGEALAELLAKRPVSISTSEPYGCSIHYASAKF